MLEFKPDGGRRLCAPEAGIGAVVHSLVLAHRQSWDMRAGGDGKKDKSVFNHQPVRQATFHVLALIITPNPQVGPWWPGQAVVVTTPNIHWAPASSRSNKGGGCHRG